MDRLALGRYLRETRESKEITLDEAVRASRIRRTVLESFEQGNFDIAESPVQARGLLRNYARYLGLDEDRVLQYHNVATDPKSNRRRRRTKRDTQNFEPVAPLRITDTQPILPNVTLAGQRRLQRSRGLRRLFLNLVLFLVAIGAIGLIISIASDLAGINQQEAPTITPLQFAGFPTTTYTPSWTPLPEQTSTPENITFGPDPAFSQPGLVLTIDLTERTWMRVITDGVVRFTGVHPVGSQVSYEAANNINILASNAAGLRATFNGRVQPLFGDRTQQVTIDFTRDNVLVQTTNSYPTESPFSPTPSATPTTPPPPTATFTPLSPDLVGLPTLTPLFGGDTTAPVDNATPTAPASSAGITPIVVTPTPNVIVTFTPALTDTPSVTPTTTPTPTSTPSPTSAAVLPPRSTPSDLPPTKPADN